MPTTPPSAADPNSPLSKTARLACWLTGGGTRRSPTTAVSFLKMARERKAVKKAEDEWSKRKKAALDAHVELWGNTGLMGTIEEAAAMGPRPRGTALLSWWREHGGGEAATERSFGASATARHEGRTVGEGTRAAEPAGGHAAEDEPGGAVAARRHNENQGDTALAVSDNVCFASGQGGGENTGESASGGNPS